VCANAVSAEVGLLQDAVFNLVDQSAVRADESVDTGCDIAESIAGKKLDFPLAISKRPLD
jgi:hypothetical protein